MIQFTHPHIQEELLWQEDELAVILEYENKNIDALSLGKQVPASRLQALAMHIELRQKLRSKIPSWFNIPQLRFHSRVNIEQCSSEATALYKSTLFQGNRLIDLTCGMGVDFIFMSKQFAEAIAVESNPELLKITQHNAALLGKLNLRFANSTSAEEFLAHYNEQADLIFVDPSRRTKTNSKVFLLQDCSPDILALASRMFLVSNTLCIKLSPMMDIHAIIQQLPFVCEIHTVAWQHECKEVLVICRKDYTGDVMIHTADMMGNQRIVFSYLLEDERSAKLKIAQPKQYIYEPNVAILKAGAYKSLVEKFNVEKLHVHTHLYTSNSLIANFPGRKFELIDVCKVKTSELYKALGCNKANLSCRNFPESVAKLRNKLALKDGGDMYVFATTLCDESKALLVCKKVEQD